MTSPRTGDSSSSSSSSSRHTQAKRRRRNLFSARLFALLGLASALSSVTAQTVTGIPAGSPSGAGSTLSPTLKSSYAGFGIEPVHLFDYLGRQTVNQLSFNLLNNLANYTGTPPHLRIGGNSGDTLLYKNDSQYSGYQIYSNPSKSGQGNQWATDEDIIGPGYFEVMDMLPKGTPVTYGLNMAYNGADYLSQIVNQAAAPFQLLKNVSIVGFEIGNEPDLYTSNGFRPSGWTATNFGTEWADRVKSIYQNVLQPRSIRSDFFEPPTTATTATKTGQQYRISNLINTGVAADSGIYVAGWNQHDYYYYVNVSTYTLTLPILLDMSTLYYQLSEWRGQALQAQVTGKPYYLREMGSVGPTGLAGITDVFGNTLWTLNVFLYCATIQMSAVQIHMTSNSYASPWQPIPLASQLPHVRTTYYAFAAMAQIIGKSCTTQIASVSMTNVPSAYKNTLAMYSVYQMDTLRSLVFVNTKAVYSGSTAGSLTVKAMLPSSLAGQRMYISRLEAPGVDSLYNTTWNGLSFEQSGDGRPTVVDSSVETITIASDGSISIPVTDSSAVVAALGSLVGSEANVDTSACSGASTTTAQAGITGTASTYGGVATSVAPTFKATGGFVSPAIGTYTYTPRGSVILLPLFLCGLASAFFLL